MANLKHFLFSPKGRISASQYVVSAVAATTLCSLLVLLLVTIGLVIVSTLPDALKLTVLVAFLVLLLLIVLPLLIWIAIALVVKRLHDRGHDGTWALLCFVPVANVILFFYLIFCKGEPRTNRFGHRPSPAPLPLAVVCYVLTLLGSFYSLKASFSPAVTSKSFSANNSQPAAKVQYDAAHNKSGVQAVSKEFYSIGYSDILLSRTKFSAKNNPKIKYVMQTVIGEDSTGYYPPQLHIKRVINGKIERDCLSYLYNELRAGKPDDPRMFAFEYHLPNNAPIDRVYGFSSIYVKTADSSWNVFERMLGTGFIGAGVGYSYGSKGSITKLAKIYLSSRLSGTKKKETMVSAAKVATKNAEWGIKDNIAAAFGKNSNCNPLGHNRRCKGCLFQK